MGFWLRGCYNSLVSRVLMISSEGAPFAKTGGLADVVGSLPAALRSYGDEVAVVIPRYGSIDLKNALRVWDDLAVHLGPASYAVSIYRAPADYPVYLVDCPPLFDRTGFYGESGVDYTDNHIRFAVFCPAALPPAGLLRRIRSGLPGQPHSLCRVLPGRAERGGLPVSNRYLPLPRLADRAGAGLPAHDIRRRPDLSRLPHAIHDSQPGIPGSLPQNGAGGGRAGPRRLPSGRHGIFRPGQLPQGWDRIRRRREHGEPHVRARDPDARIRLRHGCPPARPGERALWHPQRRGLRGLEPANGRAHRRTVFGARPERQGGVQAATSGGIRPAGRGDGPAPAGYRLA